jgi:signal transduction histidine kinase
MNSLIHAFDPGAAGNIRISAQSAEGGLTFTYADDGKGIAPESLDKIFEPFYTTKRGRGGTGLGLHIVYNIVTQKLGGTVRCESAPGKGATFIMTVPIKA